jgi:hypothetical protein
MTNWTVVAIVLVFVVVPLIIRMDASMREPW